MSNAIPLRELLEKIITGVKPVIDSEGWTDHQFKDENAESAFFELLYRFDLVRHKEIEGLHKELWKEFEEMKAHLKDHRHRGAFGMYTEKMSW